MTNTESHAGVERLADEQAALRRVATLVARESSPEEIFGAVTEEAAQVLCTEAVGMLRFEPDETATLVAQSETPWAPPPLGTRLTLDGENVVSQVFRTGEAARADDWANATGPVAAMADVLGIRSCVATPIVVDGRTWGTLIAATNRSDPLPPDTESRIREFTELVATAIANAEARSQLSRLADEQAALRRVATLVAQESSLDDVLTGVAEEFANVLGEVEWALARDDGDGMATALAVSDHNPTPAGTRVPIDAGTGFGRAIIEGRTARIDYFGLTGDFARIAQKQGIRAVVSYPIFVRGRTWGAMSVGRRNPDPFPTETESVLGRFSDLVATAIASAESREEVERLADEQAALSRVAELVAREPTPAEVFSAVAEELGQLLENRDLRIFRFEDDAAVVVGVSGGVREFALGFRAPLGGDNAASRVWRTGKPARVSDYRQASGAIGEAAKPMGVRSALGIPVVVEARTWGAIVIGSFGDDDVPADTASRLERFTELMATAIANAEARDALARLAEEQAALRRVATLVAENPESENLFSAVAREVAAVLDVHGVIVQRFEADGAQDVVGSAYDRELSRGEAVMGVGVHVPLQPGTLAAAVFETHRAARLEDYSQLEGMTGDAARAASVGSGCAAPIMVDGRLWGQMCVFAAQGTVLPPGTEQQLDDFVKLVATAISNYDARARLRMVADEQAALRHVATLVARGATPEKVFPAVAAEVSVLLGGDVSAIVRFEADGTATVLGDVGGPHNAGKRVALDAGYVVHAVRETGRSARFDTDDPSSADMSSLVRTLGVRSAVASPIVVEGELWGAITAASKDGPLAPAAEQRLTEFTELVATAVANTQARNELTVSRARIVTASDDARRRIERDLHDGAQQRLVSLGLELRMAAENVPAELPELDTRLEHVADEIDGVIDDLREMSRGIHPAVLSDGGLGPAIEMLALRATVPVELDLGPPTRFAAPVEVAGYYVVSEALTNTAKHANASRARVLVEERDGRVCVSIDDDGAGGAELQDGSGLTGLRDRVEALGGSFRLSSPPGRGTVVAVELPATGDGGPPAT